MDLSALSVWVFCYHDSNAHGTPVGAGTDAYGTTKFVEHRVQIVRSLEGIRLADLS